jgi:8-oxo-dGTP pyrophosphatase MutT (NUDIX family)
MPKFVHALLVLPDERVVFQRRTMDAKVMPGRLGFFGGRIEKKEDPLTALKRELKEETSLRVDELSITEISSYRLTKDAWNDTKRHEYLFYLFRVKIPDLNFEVYEGDGAEAYHKNEIESLDDLDKPEKYALKEIAGEI